MELITNYKTYKKVNYFPLTYQFLHINQHQDYATDFNALSNKEHKVA